MTAKHQNKLILIFITVFLIFHFTGVMTGNLPYILNALITFTVVLISLLMFDKWYSGIPFSEVIVNLGFHETTFKKTFPGILISFFLLLLYPVFHFLFGYEIYLNSSWLLNLIGLFLTGGLAEEMFFRGFLFRHLRDSMNFKKAALISMLLFAAAHLVMFIYMDWTVALFSTLLAVVISIPMSYLFEKADNTVWSPAIVHTTVRTIGLVVTVPKEDFMEMSLLWITGCMIIPLIVVICYRGFREMWKGN